MSQSYKDRFLAQSRAEIKEVPVPGMDMPLRVRQMTPAELDDFLAARGDGVDIASILIARFVVDDEGNAIWATPDEVRSQMFFQTRGLYSTAIMEVNGISEKNVEAAGKNLTPDRISDSDTSSPSGSGEQSASFPTP